MLEVGYTYYMSRLIFLFSLFTTILFYIPLNGQIPVNVNSGNPKIPFPQFQDYVNPSAVLRNLARQNSPGVTHAEMEQQIRDAWQIFANEFSYTGQVWAGKNYIKSNFGCPYDCSEGEGYSLLAAAIMGDKVTFDGIWMRIHDLRMVRYPRYIDCVIPDPGYSYGLNSLKDNTNSATDGSFDIALGLYIGWKQWGDFMGVNDACGNPISYKQEALNVIRGLVEIYNRFPPGDCRRESGSIGFDGYFKGGDTWKELTDWASGNCPEGPEFTGPAQQHIDYIAPAYFKCFGDFLQSNATAADLSWNINQFRRAEASSDWLMGQMNSQGLIPVAGWVNMTGTTPSFSNFKDGEDFRTGWRTVLSYVWNGNPTTSWNPTTHAVIPGGNTYERDLGLSFASFMKNPQARGQSCDVYAAPAISFGGPVTLRYYYTPTGSPNTTYTLNLIQGCGAPSAIASQDFDLMGEMYRQNVIEWDGSAGYLNSRPVYFHGFFRLLGMLILSGNHGSPCDLAPLANLKVYKSVDKTFAYPNDLVTYTITYRNYGSLTATGVTLKDPLPAGLSFVSASNGGTFSGGVVTWNLPNISGFVSGGLAATTGTATIVARVNGNASGRICNLATITCTNGTGWTSNEYPNNITDVMQRNCVDIVQRPLYIKKSANVTQANPGQVVNYTLDFGNQPVPFLNGGRPNVNLAFANNGTSASANALGLKFRLYHGADEAYINYKNYRISYFLQDANPNWVLSNYVYEGGLLSGVTVTQQNLNPGTNALGSWNQRMIIQFADQLATTTPHLLRYSGLANRIHQGGTMMLRAVWDMRDASSSPHNWQDDWSADNLANAADGSPYFPISNDWTDPNNPNVPVTKLHKNACNTVSHTVDNILVEEWDGYTWRRTLGDGPVSGREVQNVVVQDILPTGLTWGGFINATTLGVAASYNAGTRTITWTIPLMKINDVGQLKYFATVNTASFFGGCPVNVNLINTASISGLNESAATSSDTLNVTCNALPPTPPPPSALTKTIINPQSNYAVNSSISYLLTYTNTVGSIATPPLNSSTNWTLQSGPANLNFSASAISTVGNQSSVVTYGFAHGTNGTVTGTINPNNNATITFVLRHTGGAVTNGTYISLRPNNGAGTVAVKFWNGSVQVGSTQTVSLASGPFNFQIVLNGGQYALWLNNFSGAPLVSQSGMTVQAGYVGFLNGQPDGTDNYAVHQITAFTSRMDSGFNIQFYDPVPSNVTYVSASNAGSLTTGTVVWPMTNTTPATPLLAGATLTRTWTGTVFTCPGGFISNTGYIRVFGFTPDQGSQVNATCGVSPTPILWRYVYVESKSSGNYLVWEISDEKNVAQYEIQTSENASNFTEIGTVLPSNLNKGKYSFLDAQPELGGKYYRIKAKSFDGSYLDSKIVSVLPKGRVTVSAYPNPFSGKFNLIIDSGNSEYRFDAIVYDLSSKPVMEVNNLSPGVPNEIGEGLSSGMYVIKVIGGNQVITQKLEKLE